MGRKRGRRTSLDTAAHHRERSEELALWKGHWWFECSQVDVEALRRELLRDTFAKRRIERLHYWGDSMSMKKRLTAEERALLRARIGDEQTRRYLLAKKLKIDGESLEGGR